MQPNMNGLKRNDILRSESRITVCFSQHGDERTDGRTDGRTEDKADVR